MSFEWRRKRIGDIGRVVTGKTPSTSNLANFGGPYPFITIPDLNQGREVRNTERSISESGADSLRSCLLPKHAVLMSCIATIGKCGIATKPSFTNQQINSVICGPEVLPNYLYYVFTQLGSELEAAGGGGSVYTNVSKSRFSDIEIPIPTLREQSEISSFLGALDDRITLLRENNATLEAIAQSIFKSWFVDFDPVYAKAEGRVPQGMDEATAALFPDAFEETELGMVPKCWQVKKISDSVFVTDYVANGSFASLKENVTLLDDPSYALYVRTTDFNSGFKGDFRYVDERAYKFLSKSSLDGSEVIISNVGDVGTVFIPPSWLGLPMTLGGNAIALKAPKMSSYLYYHFTSNKGQHDIQSIVTGSAQRKFNKTNFRDLRILIPDAPVLTNFEAVAGELISRCQTNNAQIKSLSELRDALLPRLISGQLRIADAEAELEKATA
jgi:type I restriction enzyme S subunit